VAWTKPQYSREQVNAAGKALVSYIKATAFEFELWQQFDAALPVINNWRSSHGFPLNTFRVGLNRRARRIDPDSLTAQRIKRLSSIASKLQRFPLMKLSQMQDVGGCRAVLKSVDDVYRLVEDYKKSEIKHRLVGIDDYIQDPRDSGYRGVHLKYRYFSDKSRVYNDLKIEMQLRSTYQHAWATAVETVGTFVRQALKSSVGEAQWLRFFALMGTVIALKEGTPPVPGTATGEALFEEVYDLAVNLDVENRLRAYGAAIQVTQQSEQNAAYFLLEIEPATEQVKVTGFKLAELPEASDRYLAIEKDISKTGDRDAVLVSVDSVASLRRAYPNYFADTAIFAALVGEALAHYERRYLPVDDATR
jgi:hypothetical protein